jgi:hypothetical protein
MKWGRWLVFHVEAEVGERSQRTDRIVIIDPIPFNS